MADLFALMSKALDLGVEKFVIFFLIIMVFWTMRSFIRTILNQSKILDERSSKMLEAFDKHAKTLADFQSAFREDLHKAKGEMLQAKFDFMKEVQDLKSLTTDLNSKINKVEGKLSMVPQLEAAIAQYNGRVDSLEKNFNLMIDALKKQKGQK